jgi:integrase
MTTEPPAAPLALVGAALDAPERMLSPQTALTVIDGRLSRADAYASYLAGRRSECSVTTMRASLGRIAKLLGRPPEAVPWHRMRFAETEAIRGALMRAEYSPDTIRITLAALRGVLRQAKRLGLMSADDLSSATDWDRIDETSLPRGRDLSNDEIAKLDAYCTAMGPDGREWPASAYGAFLGAAFALLIGAGLRATEMSRLALPAYNPAERSLRILRKGGREKLIPINRHVATMLDAWLVVRAELAPPTQALLVRVQPDGSLRAKAALNVKVLEYLCERVGAAAGIEPFSPHDCRRTFATRALDGGSDLAEVQRLMSHASPRTTVRYDKRGYREDAAACDRLNIWPARKT